MKRLYGVGGLLMLGLIGSAVPWSPPAEGCGLGFARGRQVAIADESAIIIWDDANKTEHFIRRATFSTDAKDFGFLVPTPTQPELGEASDQSFRQLEATLLLTRKMGGFGGGKGAGGAAPAGKVQVLEQKVIAGQDVAVLKANTPEALAKWLKDNDYEYTPGLQEWAKPYVDAGWIITASKFAKGQDSLRDFSSNAVRMSFKTEKPFFPYREPSDQRNNLQSFRQARLLRIFFIANTPVKATIGGNVEKWMVRTQPQMLNSKYREDMLKLLKMPASTGPNSWWVTAFEDRSSPRPGLDEVYFHTDGQP